MSILARLLVALLLALAVPACHPQVVRDENTYRQELRYLDRSCGQLADTQLSQARASAPTCAALAEPALVVKIRNPWHIAKALANAGAGPDPGDPPTVPTAATWCGDPALAPVAGKVTP